MPNVYVLCLAALAFAAFFVARGRAATLAAGGPGSLHSMPIYHGLLASVAVIGPMLAVLVAGSLTIGRMASQKALSLLPPDTISSSLQRDTALREIVNVASGRHAGAITPDLQAAANAYSSSVSFGNYVMLAIGIGLAFLAAGFIVGRVGKAFRARNAFEWVVLAVLATCATVAVLTTIGIVFSVLFETYRFFFDPALKGRPTVTQFLFGTEWNPQAALRADQGDIKTAFGFIPLLTGTLLITVVALIVAGPLGLLSAIYLSEFATPRLRAIAKPILEILAGIPTVVLGFFAALTVAPLIRGWGEYFGLSVASESALAAGLVMGMMIIPFISSLSDDVINSVPQSLRDGAYALGATHSETIKQVVLPAALPGIVSAFMLAISRAIGETMIVVMAAGLAANLTLNPLDAVTTITVQIKTILVGDQEFDSAKTLAAFALGFVLFFVTLVLNVIAFRIVRRYREQYD
ncbi:MAG: phosphate ABC transporter permease subunit PstC [Hyphomicrobiaceae bacterium]